MLAVGDGFADEIAANELAVEIHLAKPRIRRGVGARFCGKIERELVAHERFIKVVGEQRPF